MRSSQPQAALAILGLTVVAWAVVAALGLSENLAITAGFIPARASGVYVPDALPVWITPLSSTLLHGGAIHLGFNMLMLGYCGRFVEVAIGPYLLVALYLIGAYVAAASQYLVGPMSLTPMIGASGAISAIVGAYALLFSQRRGAAAGQGAFAHWLHVLWLAAGWVIVQLLVGLASISGSFSIAIAAHIGGFIAGLLLARPFLLWRYRRA